MPESFGIRYVLDGGQKIEYEVTRRDGESVEDHLQRIGRACICAAKGVDID